MGQVQYSFAQPHPAPHRKLLPHLPKHDMLPPYSATAYTCPAYGYHTIKEMNLGMRNIPIYKSFRVGTDTASKSDKVLVIRGNH